MKQLLLVLSFVPMTFGSQAVPTVDGTWRSDSQNYWTRDRGERWVSLQLERRDDERNGFSVPAQDVPALVDDRAAGPVRFTLTRDAGTFAFEGRIDAGRGSGTFQFSANPDYLSGMARLGYANLSSDEVWRGSVPPPGGRDLAAAVRRGDQNGGGGGALPAPSHR